MHVRKVFVSLQAEGILVETRTVENRFHSNRHSIPISLAMSESRKRKKEKMHRRSYPFTQPLLLKGIFANPSLAANTLRFPLPIDQQSKSKRATTMRRLGVGAAIAGAGLSATFSSHSISAALPCLQRCFAAGY